MGQISDIDFDQLVVHETKYWVWQVHENQSYIGRLVFRFTEKFEGSLPERPESDWIALRKELRTYEQFIDQLFAPDRYNYGQLGNIYPQLHVHAVPRYKSAREWRGQEFKDPRWGKNWSPTPESPITLDQTYEFADWLKKHFKKYRSSG